jgi:Holliday junction resolvase
MSIPRWLDGETPQSKGRSFERKLAKKLGGRVQPGSGALPFAKEDVKTADYLIQCKSTTKNSYTIKLDDLETLRQNAIKIGKQPCFVLQIGGKTWEMRLQ